LPAGISPALIMKPATPPWTPVPLRELLKEIDASCDCMDTRLLHLWHTIRITPQKWQLHPWGDEGEGFWVVGVIGGMAIWYNDIEEGFNRSHFTTWGRIDEYRCNQDELRHTLYHLANLLNTGVDTVINLGAPLPVQQYDSNTLPAELKTLLSRVAEVPDFSYVEFTDINTSNALGDNALHIAVFWEDLAAVKLLVEAGIDINKHGENGHTPLHIACETGNAEIVTYLLEHGADPHARTEGDTPFKTARLNAHDAICDLLNKHFERHPQRGAPSSTSLHLAALQKEIEERCGGHPD
jgi:hypothetical protein